MKALVIFSGGQDSTTCLAWALNNYSEVEAITFNYKQRHDIEIKQAKKIANIMKVKHKVIDITYFNEMVNSNLTNDTGNINVQHKDHENLPSSFVPNRNALFITLAHAYAQKTGAGVLVTGVNSVDYSGYPDCRPAFIHSIQKTLTLASEKKILIKTPLIKLTKGEIFRLSAKLGILSIIFDYTMTCYNGITRMNAWGMGCGNCPACEVRKKGYSDYIKKV